MLIDKLRTDGFKGKVIASSYAGEFCLTGNGLEGYSIAADDLPPAFPRMAVDTKFFHRVISPRR